jgi:MFS family permease
MRADRWPGSVGPGAGGRAAATRAERPDGAYAWWRLAASLALSTIGGIGLWSAIVSLPAIQAEFGVDRGDASLPYTATMVGFALGGVLMGRLADRFGIVVPVIVGALMLGIGYVAAANAASLWQFMLAQALLIGLLGSSATFGPLVADVSLWFVRRRGIAVAIVASGNYLAGTIWPPLLQAAIEAVGWRQAHLGIAAVCALTMLPLALALRRRAPVDDASVPLGARDIADTLRMSPATLQVLLVVAGLACCIAPTSDMGRRAAPKCSRSCSASAWSAGSPRA